ncbi:MAG: hypothetical protein R2850_08310 [Bacteroidia bacterium]
MTVDNSGDVGEHLSFEIVDGHPAIAYNDFLKRDLKYVRAADANGDN